MKIGQNKLSRQRLAPKSLPLSQFQPNLKKLCLYLTQNSKSLITSTRNLGTELRQFGSSPASPALTRFPLIGETLRSRATPRRGLPRLTPRRTGTGATLIPISTGRTECTPQEAGNPGLALESSESSDPLAPARGILVAFLLELGTVFTLTGILQILSIQGSSDPTQAYLLGVGTLLVGGYLFYKVWEICG